jgi:hypothetical protein
MVSTVVALLLASTPMSIPALAAWQHNIQINADVYKKQYGHWDIVNLPAEFRLNTVHAALLPTGKVLLVAGSGNNQDTFNKYNDYGIISVLKTVVFDPMTNQVKVVQTPSDLFCSGHALLQSGNVLVAGGTTGYESLANTVSKPAGGIIIHNESPNGKPRIFKKGTKFVNSSTGKVYVSTQDVTVKPAMKMSSDDGKQTVVMHSSAGVFIEASVAGPSYVTSDNDHYNIVGLQNDDMHNIYGQGGPMTLKKQDYRGDSKSYEFDPIREQYVRVGDLNVSRWYPSLPVLTNGDVLAVSGLDNTGNITQATERYDPATKTWTLGPSRAFPTYPSLFRTQDPNVLFFSGSNAGYGPKDQGRRPGLWNVRTNSFQPVRGLRQTDILETSGSVALPPIKASNDGSQNTKVMLAGGGGIGDSSLVTARTDIINLADPQPRYTPGPDLPVGVRYLNMTVTPWDEVFANGGSVDYRARSDSYSYKSYSINPTTNQIAPLADELVGRSYHSGSLLLPDGRILVFGNNPIYADKDNTAPGGFEQRLEIFTPPQLYASSRPVLKGVVTQEVHRGQELTFHTDGSTIIKTARLIPPSTTTHVTNVEQRSIAAIVKQQGAVVTIDLPFDSNLLSNGWYMLFVTNAQGTPSHAMMLHVAS